MRITRVYTRAGDGGFTALGGGQQVAKDSPRIEACGAIDELNSILGLVLSMEIDARLREELQRVQNDLFHLGSDLCLLEEDKKEAPAPRIEGRHVERLEAFIDRLLKELEPLEEFVLPGGAQEAAALHLARAVCRRAERRAFGLSRAERIGAFVIKYLNRLSDVLFVMARYENRRRSRADVLWDKKA